MAIAPSLADFSRLIGDIYDCAIDPARWPATLQAICDRLGFVNAVLAIQPLPSGPSLLSATTGIPPPFIATLPEFGADALAQWGGPEAALARPVGQPLVLSEVNPAACTPARTDRYYLEWREPQGLVDTLNITLLREPALIGVASFGRHRDAGLISPREVEMARLLIPHLRRATAISHMLDVRLLEAATFRSVLDRLSVPTLIVNAGLDIVYANAAASGTLARGDPIKAIGSRLAFTTTKLGGQVRAAVGQAAADDGGSGLAATAFGALTAEGDVCVFHILPLRGSALRSDLMPDATAAIFVRAAVPDPVMPIELIADLFVLTPSEAAVLDLIAQGMTTTAVSQKLAIQPSTTKTHLLHIFDKVGVHRQTDLVRLAASLTLPTR